MIFKTASELVGTAVGISGDKAKTILKSAEGSVLIVDEAYTLCSQVYEISRYL